MSWDNLLHEGFGHPFIACKYHVSKVYSTVYSTRDLLNLVNVFVYAPTMLLRQCFDLRVECHCDVIVFCFLSEISWYYLTPVVLGMRETVILLATIRCSSTT